MKMSGHPTCEVVLRFHQNRKYFTAGDDLNGKICIKTTIQGQLIKHEGIKVSLLGMILQLPQYGMIKRNEDGVVMNLNEKRSEITAQNISTYRQYTFMQIQKEVECAGEFNDYKELEFNFKKLDEELSEHETYNGVDNFIKYFIKVHMIYQGGSLVTGNNLEKLHEIVVKNHHASRNAKKKAEEMKFAEEPEEAEAHREEEPHESALDVESTHLD